MSENTGLRGPDINFDPFLSNRPTSGDPVVLGEFNAPATDNGPRVVDASEVLDRLRNTHEGTVDVIARHANLLVVHSSDPIDHEGVVTLAERTRSFKSYESTASHIAKTLGGIGIHRVTVVDDVGLLRQIADPNRSNPDLVWLNSAGVQGRDPMAQTPGLLEAAGIPYIGHRPAANAVADNKVFAEDMLRTREVPVPRSVDLRDFSKDDVVAFAEGLVRSDTSYAIVKPINGRGSVGVERLVLSEYTPLTLAERLSELSGRYSGIKVDEFLPGKEVTVSVMRTADQTILFPPLLRAIDPKTGIFESLDLQAVAGRATALDPQDSDFVQVASTTSRAYEALGLEGLARLDLRADEAGVFRVIDVNPKPDLGTNAKKSLSEIAIAYSGISVEGLMEFILLCRIDRGFDANPSFREFLTSVGGRS